MKDLRTRILSGIRQLTTASVPLIALLLIGLVFFLGIRTERTGFVRDVLDPGIKRITRPVLNVFRGSPPEVDRLTVLLSAEGLDSLMVMRDSALTAGYLEPERNPSYAVQLITGNDSVNGQAELVAGRVDHLRSNKWQLLIQGEGPTGPMNFTRFQLDDPTRTGHLHSWLLHRAAEHCALPSLSIGLTEVQLNERSRGLHTAIEMPDSSTLQRWALGDGPVVSFDRTMHDRATVGLAGLHFTALPLPQEQMATAAVMMMPTGKVPTTERALRAVNLLIALQQGSKPIREVLDLDRTAALFALHDLFGAQAALTWTNMAFLLDSAGNRLIPFVLHPLAGKPIAAIGSLDNKADPDVLIQRIHSDRYFRPRYHSWLDTLSAPGWMEDLQMGSDSTVIRLDRTLQVEYPDRPFDKRVLAHDRTVIRRTLYPKDMAIAIAQDGPEGYAIRIANIHVLPLEVEAILIDGDTIPLAIPLLLPARFAERPLDYWDVPLPEGDLRAATHALLRVEGTQRARAQAIRRRSTLDAQVRQ
jgi:hypothetical protein